jgi:L-ribulose-5-phosphate 3-epimerase
MRILLHTMATPHLEPLAALDLARELDFDGIDLITQVGYRCALDPGASDAEARGLAAEADRRNMPIRALTPYLKELNSPDRAIREATVKGLRRAVEHAAILGASSVRVLAGADVPAADWGASLAVLVDTLSPLADFAQSYGVSLNIENHDGTLADDAARSLRVWQALDHPAVGIIYDPANLVRDGKEGFPENLTLQAKGIRAVHVKDYIFAPGYPARRRAMAIGDGVIPWAEMLAGLQDIGFDGDLSVEYETRWVPEQLPPPERGLKRSCDHLRGLLTSLRGA